MISFSQYELGQVSSRLSSGKGIASEEILNQGKYPVYGGNGLRGYTSTCNFNGECAIIGRQGAFCGNVRFFSGEAYMTEHAIVFCANANNDTRYISYILSQMKLGTLSGQSAQPGLSVKTLSKLLINLPSLEYQRKVTKILRSIEEKIFLNTQINRNLEEQAKAIFKSWFVDFEPFRDGKFVDSELGPIPEGWNVGKLSEICNLNTSRRPVKEIALERYISTENMLQNREGITIAAGIPETGNATSFMKDDILISNIRPYFKKIWFASFEGGCSTDVLCFRSIEKGNSRFLFNILDDDKFFAHIMSGAKGTKMPRGDKQQMMNYAIVIPPLKIMREFSDMTRCFEEERRRNIEESHHLAALRDTLLPKLMSGEIDVSEVEV